MLEREFTRVLPGTSGKTDFTTESFNLVHEGKTHVIKVFPFTIGTAKENHLILRDKFISRYQCRIARENGAYIIEDLNSTNGTCLDGERIKKKSLHAFHQLQLGETKLTIKIKCHQEKLKSMMRSPFHGIYTQSQNMYQLFNLIKKFAPREEPVWICGQTGCGKELVARALQLESRRPGAFIALNCGAISSSLFESELFGHVKGAFTGAHKNKKGAFELAHEGTLFLDEIAELPLKQQIKLLRVLETGLVTPVGSEKPMKVSVRLICATHQDIKYLVAEKKFREDLFFRLWTLPLSVPSLQERKNDIPYLAKHFAALKGKNMESKLLKILSSHPWPGNIRELKNTIFHLAALAEEENIASSHWHERESQGSLKFTDLKKIEKKQIISVLSHFKWNKSKVAESLGLSRTSLYRKIKQYNVYSEERLKK